MSPLHFSRYDAWAVARRFSLNAGELKKRILDRYGIRIDDQMTQYVLRHLEQAGKAPPGATVPVMGGDARTGVPRREFLDLARLGAPGERA